MYEALTNVVTTDLRVGDVLLTHDWPESITALTPSGEMVRIDIVRNGLQEHVWSGARGVHSLVARRIA